MAAPNSDAQSDDDFITPWRDPNPWRAFRHAADGIVHVTRTQRNMFIHLVLLTGIVLLAALLRVGAGGLIALCFAGALVLMAEMFNTAVEVVVDMVTAEYHPLAKRAKDIAAGAVFIAAIHAVIVGIIVFGWLAPTTPLAFGLPLPPQTLWIIPVLILLPLVSLVAIHLRRRPRAFKTRPATGNAWDTTSKTADAPSAASQR